MPKYIVKLTDSECDYYLEWSTIVDAPTTHGMSLQEFREYYVELHGSYSIPELEDRLKRVEECGTSSINGQSPRDLLNINRAGLNETSISIEQIINAYCKNVHDELPLGEKILGCQF